MHEINRNPGKKLTKKSLKCGKLIENHKKCEK